MRNSIKALILIGVVLALFLSSGCKQYKIEVTVNEDGSGARTVMLTTATIGENDFDIELDEFIELFGLSEKRGWTMKREVKQTEEGEKPDKYIFTLDSRAKRISSWQAMSGDLDVRGTLDKGPLEDVFFHNEIEVERSDGKTITYRETLTWNKLKEKITDMTAVFLAKRLGEEYPFLSQKDRDEIQYFLAGMLIVSFYSEEVAHDEMTDELYTQTACDYITYMLKERYPDRNWSGLAERLEHILMKDGEKHLNNVIKEKLPGAYLAGHTSITFTITMPGKIVDSNATSVEGNTATWKYDLMLVSFNHPVELYIKSEIAE